MVVKGESPKEDNGVKVIKPRQRETKRITGRKRERERSKYGS